MSQITIYLDHEFEKKIKKAAKQSKLSVSKWILRAAEKNLKSGWPEVLALAGSWAEKDFPEGESLRKLVGADIPNLAREDF